MSDRWGGVIAVVITAAVFTTGLLTGLHMEHEMIVEECMQTEVPYE